MRSFRSALLLAGALTSLAAPAVHAADDVTTRWAETLGEGKGPFGYLAAWMTEDDCKSGFRGCKRFAELRKGVKPWPADFVKDVLTNVTVGEGMSTTGGFESRVCIPNSTCRLVFPALEMIAIAQRPEDKAVFAGFLGNTKQWKEHLGSSRPKLVRLIGWYGDKSLAPLVKEYAEAALSGDDDNATIAAAAWLFTQWNDKSLVSRCASVFSPDAPEDNRDLARDACAAYLVRMGDKSVAGKLKRNPTSRESLTAIAQAAMGDSSDKADWQKKVKETKDIGNPDRVKFSSALAVLGDAGAQKDVATGLSGANVDAAFEYGLVLQALSLTSFAPKALEAAKRGVAKLGNKEKAGRAKAMLVAALLRSGDASVLKEVKGLLAGEEDVRQQMARALAGNLRGGALIGPDGGEFGGAPVAGLGAVLAEAWSNESDGGIRGDIGMAWVMLKGAGGN